MKQRDKMQGKFIHYLLLAAIATIGLLSIISTGGDGGDGGGGVPDDYFFWESLGSPGVGWGTPSAMAIDPSDNKPIVVFRDLTDFDNGRPHAVKWSGGTYWTDMGFLTTVEGDHPSLAIDPSDNKPFVVFVDNANSGRTRMKKWASGTSWTDMGFASTGDSRGWWRRPSITIDPSDNKPVVAFRDWASPLGADVHVMKWSGGTSWIGLGWPSEGTSGSSSIAIDPADFKPVVMYSESNEPDAKVYVAKHP